MRFITGDELGSIKILRYITQVTDGPKAELKIVHTGSAAVQKLSALRSSDSTLIAAAYSDALVNIFSLQNNDSLQRISGWTESRLKNDQRFVGLALSNDEPDPSEPSKSASVPTRLLDWKLSPTCQTFAYGGDEVDLSIWNVERSFNSQPEDKSSTSTSGKRKRAKDGLFSAEEWRAKNTPNDNLGLRKPIRITSLSYIAPSDSHLLAGTQIGDVRRYDTRAARRPVSDWKGVAKLGGIKVVECGSHEHEAFVSDGGSNLYSLDLRNGKITYGYKNLSGSVSSIAVAPSMLGSVAQDRYVRIHSTYPPPREVGQQQEQRGEILEKDLQQEYPDLNRVGRIGPVNHFANSRRRG
ncbi:hypothetical protein D9758_003290 [Tetrapyrgos nigripes]|uniref:Ribosome biogenesis protein NSA1 n=1 Tax=Tetrapyrgos nigripes TaxID=182062 RepID=A0A8H5LQ11_9AGAR|nr:hypothetical protein D9758_003290 [Tetrapyrgos nigripes]